MLIAKSFAAPPAPIVQESPSGRLVIFRMPRASPFSFRGGSVAPARAIRNQRVAVPLDLGRWVNSIVTQARPIDGRSSMMRRLAKPAAQKLRGFIRGLRDGHITWVRRDV